MTTQNSDIILEDSLKKQIKTYVGIIRWVPRYFQVSNTHLIEYSSKPADSKQSLTKEEKCQSWSLRSIDVIAKENSDIFQKLSSKFKIVFSLSDELKLMAANPQEADRWVKKILHTKIEQETRTCIDYLNEKYFLHTSTLDHSSQYSDLEKQGNQSRLQRRSLHFDQRLKSKISTDLVFDTLEESQQSSLGIYSGMILDKGRKQILQSYNMLRDKSSQNKKEIKENEKKLEELSKHYQEMELRVEEVKTRMNDPAVLALEKSIMEREQKLKIRKEKLILSQRRFEDNNNNNNTKNERGNYEQIKFENIKIAELQKKKLKYIQNQEHNLKNKEQNVNRKNHDIQHVGEQLSNKYLEYNQRKVEMDHRETMIRNAEQSIRERTKDLEKKEQKLRKKEKEAKKRREKKKEKKE